ncbi:MAG: hypothetical protein KKC71_04660 [Chloroflexi bacterium]|nr:hypothetical protein [Chloroflexota bacterium]
MSKDLGQPTLGGQDKRRFWLPIVAAARLSENIPEMEGWLVKQVRRWLRES